jgi:ribosome-associated protein
MSSPSSTPTAQLVGLPLARACGRYAYEKQAEDLMILDLRGLSQLCDFFVMCSGKSLPHLKAIRDEVVHELADAHSVRPNHRDGAAESQWMVLDFIDVVVHILHQDAREHYAIEDLWSDAPRLDWRTGEPLPETQEADADDDSASL